MLTGSLVALSLVGLARALNITVSSSGGNYSSGLEYGIMFEDISHSGDGGIYAELIRNRAFQGSTTYPSVVDPWTSVNDAVLTLKNLSNPLSESLPTSLNVAAGDSSSTTIGISNPGWWGIEVKEQEYTGSFYVKGAYSGDFTVSLVSSLTNETLGSTSITSNSTASQWTQYEFTLTPSGTTNENNTFTITFDSSKTNGSLDFNLISLFPPTYNGRKNGLRKDLMEALADLKPSFLRMPGGNNLEGESPPDMWKWNETIGDLKDRPGRTGPWGYINTDGLGLVEYLQWCDDLDMEPVLAVWAGLYLDGTVISKAGLTTYIEDTMNELEFIMGDTSTEYGALRESLGYPDPWTIKYIEVGNEDNLNSGLSSYQSYRFSDFMDAILETYPDMEVIASTVVLDPNPTGAAGDYHQYTRPDYFVSQFDFFDNDYTSAHPTLIGEYAVIQPNLGDGSGANWSTSKLRFPTWIGSVSESIFTIGMERNCDKMIGASYAPLFQNLNSYEWSPDLISYSAYSDNTVLSTSYYAIQLLSTHRFTQNLPTTSTFDPLYYVAGLNNETSTYVFKAAVYNTTSSADVDVSLAFDGLAASVTATMTVLTAPSGYATNTVGSNVVETAVQTVVAGAAGVLEFSLPELSVAVLEVAA
ncbi:MAG: hypothetical protein M1834_008400 [Cirrosporium novae-zelandiae]|nr:MAG: hypothetical protein M1834_008400 [Cirrosporium novae-zelandiae]